MATGYFFIYMSFFVIFGFVSSFLIIPLLTTSFFFAIGVVLFGFLSNITFKSGQFVYFKADKRLKKLLELMWFNLQKPNTISADCSAHDTNDSSITLPFLSDD